MYKVPTIGDKLYYARIQRATGVYDICELTIRTVEETYFVGVDKKDKRAHLFNYDALGDIVFENRAEALKVVHAAEKNKIEVSEEVFYEEY